MRTRACAEREGAGWTTTASGRCGTPTRTARKRARGHKEGRARAAGPPRAATRSTTRRGRHASPLGQISTLALIRVSGPAVPRSRKATSRAGPTRHPQGHGRCGVRHRAASRGGAGGHGDEHEDCGAGRQASGPEASASLAEHMCKGSVRQVCACELGRVRVLGSSPVTPTVAEVHWQLIQDRWQGG